MSRTSLLIALALVVILVVGYLVVKRSAPAAVQPMPDVVGQPAPVQPAAALPSVAAVLPPWQCALASGGNANIIRRVDGVVECATSNGRDCFWYDNLVACNAAFAGVAKDGGAPLNCAGNHIAIHGDGRTNPTHWCYSQRSDV